ncbi:GNAT family N-acetyltransferase [Marivibrio halodurans]|uniref:GNAT family N-acetyltransferase n=1 Tax=Marivibrio halodurans TaxID=2039722 RepID=A0A8J7V2M8_9PROT|nr:GNAT family N-acetyltransferase [Marivibrio halodurans]MBP5857082.1 GNAT family N-acetyltransferase [Marivibrio halodurans]
MTAREIGDEARPRAARPGDIEALTDLYTAFYREDGIAADPARIRRNLATMLRDDRARILVAPHEGVPIGMASATLTFGIEFGWAAEVEDLYVDPAHRGRGLARRLVVNIMEWARVRGAEEIILIITPEAERAQGLTRFYRKLGFSESGRITMYRDAGLD